MRIPLGQEPPFEKHCTIKKRENTSFELDKTAVTKQWINLLPCCILSSTMYLSSSQTAAHHTEHTDVTSALRRRSLYSTLSSQLTQFYLKNLKHLTQFLQNESNWDNNILMRHLNLFLMEIRKREIWVRYKPSVTVCTIITVQYSSTICGLNLV